MSIVHREVDLKPEIVRLCSVDDFSVPVDSHSRVAYVYNQKGQIIDVTSHGDVGILPRAFVDKSSYLRSEFFRKEILPIFDKDRFPDERFVAQGADDMNTSGISIIKTRDNAYWLSHGVIIDISKSMVDKTPAAGEIVSLETQITIGEPWIYETKDGNRVYERKRTDPVEELAISSSRMLLTAKRSEKESAGIYKDFDVIDRQLGIIATNPVRLSRAIIEASRIRIPPSTIA